MSLPNIRLLETPEEMDLVEELQRQVWPGSETDVVPKHVLITVVHNGGLVLGAFEEEKLIGFVFGFPGLEKTPDGPRPKHCSHQMGIHPEHRDSGIGFELKRAQWQMVRHQSLDHITWTFDPLLSRNAHLNIAKLGAVCSTYRQSEYGDLRDGLNARFAFRPFSSGLVDQFPPRRKKTQQTSAPNAQTGSHHPQRTPRLLHASILRRRLDDRSRACASL
ncbi:MAG: GNAT family N-acetyltransferase [Anaerolineales bacterium]|nr:GNAT family N-acetyltransferase [Anaerolineales bacterium]